MEAFQPDVLCLQETKVQDSEFPIDAFARTGYFVYFRGMKSYNGVALVTRREPTQLTFGLLDDHDPGDLKGLSYARADDSRVCCATIEGVKILNTYVPQGFDIDSPKYAYKLMWFKRLRSYFERHFSAQKPVVWCGDLNVAPRELDVHSPTKHLNHVCFHSEVREAYANTVSWGFVDVFRKLYPEKQQYTFWDYRKPSSFEANRGWRIDHILATPTLAETCSKVEVDLEPRRRPSASDHTFLWAEFLI